MKTKRIYGKLLLLPAALLAFASCLDKIDKIPISIGSAVYYVVQQPSAGDENVMEYLPHIGFYYSGVEELDYGIISKDGVDLVLMTSKQLQVCQINPQDYKTTSLKEINGTYFMNPVSVKGNDWGRSVEIEYKGDETVGEFDVSGFGYDRGTLYATFTKAENAKYYGFYIQPFIGGVLTQYYAYIYPNEKISVSARTENIVFEDENSIKVAYGFNPATYYTLGIEKFRITPLICNINEENNSTLLRLSTTHADLSATQYLEEIEFIPE